MQWWPSLHFQTQISNTLPTQVNNEGLYSLINALASNPRIQLEKLNLYGTRITEKGYQALEEYMTLALDGFM